MVSVLTMKELNFKSTIISYDKKGNNVNQVKEGYGSHLLLNLLTTVGLARAPSSAFELDEHSTFAL